MNIYEELNYDVNYILDSDIYESDEKYISLFELKYLIEEVLSEYNYLKEIDEIIDFVSNPSLFKKIDMLLKKTKKIEYFGLKTYNDRNIIKVKPSIRASTFTWAEFLPITSIYDVKNDSYEFDTDFPYNNKRGSYIVEKHKRFLESKYDLLKEITLKVQKYSDYFDTEVVQNNGLILKSNIFRSKISSILEYRLDCADINEKNIIDLIFDIPLPEYNHEKEKRLLEYIKDHKIELIKRIPVEINNLPNIYQEKFIQKVRK